MSLSLAKKCIRDFDLQESSAKIKKGKKAKQKAAVVEAKESEQDEKIKKLLMLNSCIDNKLSKKVKVDNVEGNEQLMTLCSLQLLRTVMKTKRARRPAGRGKTRAETPKEPESTSIFTEEDFKNFEQDYGNEQLN